MRKNYPLISAEFNDIFQDIYCKLTYILGYDDDTGTTTYSGQFDDIEHKLRESVYIVVNQLSGDALVLNKNADASKEIPLYTTWGRQIIINKLRSM